MVLTIDPAGGSPSHSASASWTTLRARSSQLPTAGGSLDAMMLDMKRTFDDVVVAHSTPEKAAAILENPFYKALSTSFSGTQEYMAMEKLATLAAQRTSST